MAVTFNFNSLLGGPTFLKFTKMTSPPPAPANNFTSDNDPPIKNLKITPYIVRKNFLIHLSLGQALY